MGGRQTRWGRTDAGGAGLRVIPERGGGWGAAPRSAAGLVGGDGRHVPGMKSEGFAGDSPAPPHPRDRSAKVAPVGSPTGDEGHEIIHAGPLSDNNPQGHEWRGDRRLGTDSPRPARPISARSGPATDSRPLPDPRTVSLRQAPPPPPPVTCGGRKAELLWAALPNVNGDGQHTQILRPFWCATGPVSNRRVGSSFLGCVYTFWKCSGEPPRSELLGPKLALHCVWRRAIKHGIMCWGCNVGHNDTTCKMYSADHSHGHVVRYCATLLHLHVWCCVCHGVYQSTVLTDGAQINEDTQSCQGQGALGHPKKILALCVDNISLWDTAFGANTERFQGLVPLLPHLCPKGGGYVGYIRKALQKGYLEPPGSASCTDNMFEIFVRFGWRVCCLLPLFVNRQLLCLYTNSRNVLLLPQMQHKNLWCAKGWLDFGKTLG